MNPTTKKCDCDPVANSLANCKTCSTIAICTSCVSNLYYVSSSDSLCHPCQDFDSHCLHCSDYSMCILCDTGYIPQTQSDGTELCVLCSTVILNCTECSSLTVCTNCDYLFGVNSTSKCQLCEPLVMPGCLLCEDSSECLSCNSTTILISGVCHFCNELYMCETCLLNSLNQL